MEYIKKCNPRSVDQDLELKEVVGEIISKVIAVGDEAVRFYSEKFDDFKGDSFCIGREEIALAYEEVDDEILESIKLAARNIEKFARAQKECIRPLDGFETCEGVYLGHKIIPVDSCLCYVPGGRYPLYSTALMLGIPAKIAGVKRIVACSPVDRESGRINPATVVAMDIAGVDEIYGLGGAQAIAAFSHGTESIKPVNVVVGPGNKYVTEAKRQCYGKVGIDFVAGPSEVLIIADSTADPKLIAADILAQSEHDVMAKGILLTTDREVGIKTVEAVEAQLDQLGTVQVARQAWKDNGEIILMDNLNDCVEYSNQYAPEHLEVHVEDLELRESLGADLRNYGSLFIGQNTGEVFGDYVSGTNHTLPTLSAAAYTGGLWVGTFLKVCTYQNMSGRGSLSLIPLASTMARGEGLEAHAAAANIRSK